MICCLSKRHICLLPKCLEWNNKFHHTKFHVWKNEEFQKESPMILDLYFQVQCLFFLLVGFISLISHRFSRRKSTPNSPCFSNLESHPRIDPGRVYIYQSMNTIKSTIHVVQIFSIKTITYHLSPLYCGTLGIRRFLLYTIGSYPPRLGGFMVQYFGIGNLASARKKTHDPPNAFRESGSRWVELLISWHVSCCFLGGIHAHC